MMTTIRTTRRAAAAVLVAMVFSLAAGYAPVQTADAAQISGTFRNKISKDAAAATVVASTDASVAKTVRTAARTTTTIQKATPAPTAGSRRTATSTRSSSTSGSTSKASSSSGSAPKASSTPAAAPANDAARARSILAGYISRYPILAGATVSFGDAKGHQAICYYKSGRIVISSSHTSSLDRIIGHEVWHIIDWRDNGVIDWGENVPPR